MLIGALIVGFDRIKETELEDIVPKTRFSVVIPFRNESKHLNGLLKSILNLAYPRPHFEIIFVNDASEDNSVQLIEAHLRSSNIDFQIINLKSKSTSPKKEAITQAIAVSKNDWIITTDADCFLPRFWLDSYDHFIQRNESLCISGPVTYFNVDSFLKRFQLLDFLSLQGATIGGFGLKHPFLCNGANFAYRKSLFQDMNGYEGNSQITSGDDVFFLQKVRKTHHSGIHYLKNRKAVVRTMAQPDLKSLISQRIRWAAKASGYESLFAKTTAIIVFLMSGFLVCSPVLTAAGFLSPKSLLYMILIKIGIDFLLVFKTSRFFEQESLLASFVLSAFCYPFFAVYVAFLSIFKGFKWKGRSYSK
ncbi:MAG: glycosyltransferase [Psychroserpens sp.]|nr:glycosyltransferase [Psychroserpens sp.]